MFSRARKHAGRFVSNAVCRPCRMTLSSLLFHLPQQVSALLYQVASFSVFVTTMSNTVGGNGCNKQFNLSQIVALGVAYSRIFKACRLPLLTVAAPFVIKVVCFLSDRLTMDHSILSLIMTASFTIAIRRMIQVSAPSSKLAEDSLAKTEVRLPALMFLVSVAFIRIFIVRIERRVGVATIFAWSPIITFSLAFRLAVGMSLLGIAVICRYIGPASFGKCAYAYKLLSA